MKDLSHLPTEGEGSHEGIPQVEPTQIMTAKLAEHWMDKYKAAGRDDKPVAIEGTRLRGSWAGMCARRISYYLLGVEETDPPDIAGFWRMELGTITHDYYQALAQDFFDNAVLQVEAVAAFANGNGSVHTDLLLLDPDTGKRIAVEIKTVGGYKHKASLGLVKTSDPPGPDPQHFLQGAVNALAHDADGVVIVYLAQENVNKGWAADKEIHPSQKFSTEWAFEREEWEPFAKKEEARLKEILRLAEEGTLAPRYVPISMPPGSRVVDPSTSSWEHTLDGEVVAVGSLWNGNFCDYCPFQARCIQDLEDEQA